MTEDRRGSPMGGIPIGVGGGGIGVLLLILLAVLTGNVPGGGGGGGGPLDPFSTVQSPAGTQTIEEGSIADFSDRIHTDVEDMWAGLFQRAGREYRNSRLVLFTQATRSACGGATAAVGPHYCPPDNTVYIDTTFFQELRDRFGARGDPTGDFAQAYVIAHEVAHHVQNVLGINDRVQNREDSIRLELQADCLAGVWGYTAEQRDLLDPRDVEEGLGAAAAVGDDRIQERTTGRIDPESWTHGSAEQRMRWFTRGMRDGDPGACDTFSGEL
jgi:predicted metalloprotease